IPAVLSLEPPLQTNDESLCPEIRGLEEDLRPIGSEYWAASRKKRNLRRIDDAVDLVARTDCIAEVEEVVADEEAAPIAELQAGLEGPLRHDGEGRAGVSAEIGALGIHAAVE